MFDPIGIPRTSSLFFFCYYLGGFFFLYIKIFVLLNNNVRIRIIILFIPFNIYFTICLPRLCFSYPIGFPRGLMFFIASRQIEIMSRCATFDLFFNLINLCQVSNPSTISPLQLIVLLFIVLLCIPNRILPF